VVESYQCFDCQRVFVGVTERKCPSCGGTNGQLLSKERLDEGMKSGAIYNIDPKTGKRAKKKK
jgi:hypothetical protein